MNRHLFAIVLASALCSPVGAQSQSGSAQAGGQASAQASSERGQTSGNASASSSANSSSANAGVASGTAFNAALTKPVDAKKAKVGDRVDARTTEAVKTGNKTALPKGTRLVGHVTQASARANGDSQSALAIAFDRAVLKDGSEVPLNVGIQALASEQTVAASEPEVDSRSTGRASAGASGAGRGSLGGVSSTAGGVAGGAGSTAGSVVNAAGHDVNGAASATTGVAGATRATGGGLNAAGQLTSNSRGVFGLNGLNLNSAAASTTQGSVITSADKNIHLASGTRMLLVTDDGAASSHP
jgi:hypothetical protein